MIKIRKKDNHNQKKQNDNSDNVQKKGKLKRLTKPEITDPFN